MTAATVMPVAGCTVDLYVVDPVAVPAAVALVVEPVAVAAEGA